MSPEGSLDDRAVMALNLDTLGAKGLLTSESLPNAVQLVKPVYLRIIEHTVYLNVHRDRDRKPRLRPATVLTIVPLLVGTSFIVVGGSFWTTECSYDSCGVYQTYGWLGVLGAQVVAVWASAILLLAIRPLAMLRGFWKAHVGSRPRTAIVLATMLSGLLGILLRYIMGWPPFYPENFLQNYVPSLFGGALAGLLFALLMNWDSSRKASVHTHR